VAALHARRGGWTLAAAKAALAFAPSVAMAAFRLRQRLRGAV